MNSTSFSEINPSNLEQTQHDCFHYPFLPLHQAQDQPVGFFIFANSRCETEIDRQVPFEPLEGFSNFIEIDATHNAMVAELHYLNTPSQQSGFINPSPIMPESQLSDFGGPQIDMAQQMDPMLFQTDQPNPLRMSFLLAPVEPYHKTENILLLIRLLLEFTHESLFPHPQEHVLPAQQGEKKGRGRPRKHPLLDPSLPKRGKGRPAGARDSYKRLAKGEKSEMSRGQRLKEVLSRKAQRQEEIQGTASRSESQNSESF